MSKSAAPAGQKLCTGCSETKALAEFQRDSKSSDGLQSRCKGCRKRKGKNARHQQALDCSRDLIILVGKYPDAEIVSILNAAIDKVRVSGQRTSDRDTVAVVRAIRLHFCHTVEDIVDETKLPDEDVKKILSGLVATRRVRETPRGGKTDEARGAVEMLYFMIDVPQGMSQVLP